MIYYLGLDNGGTNTKAALFTEDGAQVAVESVATDAFTPVPGFVERDMEEMWQDNCGVVRRLLERFSFQALIALPPERVCALYREFAGQYAGT